jgi:hypothetical protein
MWPNVILNVIIIGIKNKNMKMLTNYNIFHINIIYEEGEKVGK